MKPPSEETIRLAEHLLRRGALAALLLLPECPCQETKDRYGWEQLVNDLRQVRAAGHRPQAVVRLRDFSLGWGIGVFGEYLPSNIGFQQWQQSWLEPPFDVPPEE